jgi:hypothetical protein
MVCVHLPVFTFYFQRSLGLQTAELTTIIGMCISPISSSILWPVLQTPTQTAFLLNVTSAFMRGTGVMWVIYAITRDGPIVNNRWAEVACKLPCTCILAMQT